MTTASAILTSARVTRRRSALRTGIMLAVLAGVLYIGLLVFLYVGQERLLFPATPLPAAHRFSFDVPFREVEIAVRGATLNALHFTQANPRGLVFFLHGNAGNLETWTTGVDFYRRVNYDLFILDYRGYGKSTGHIESEAQLHADVRAGWDAIAPRYRDKPIVIYGRSLGTGLAVPLARDVDPALLILVTPYTSITAAAKARYPFVPTALLKYPLHTDAVIGSVKSPILFAHGTNDKVIPLASSQQLLALARAPAELLTVEGAGHNDIHRFPAYVGLLADRLTHTAVR